MPEGSPRRWSIKTTGDVREWLRSLRQADPDVYRSVNVAIDMLAEIGPGLGRPLIGTLQGSSIANLKELQGRRLDSVESDGDSDRQTAYDGWLAAERKRRENS